MSRVSAKPDSGDPTLLSAPAPADRYEEDIDERVRVLERAKRDLERRVGELERATVRQEDLERVRGEATGRWQVIVIAVVMSSVALTVLVLALLGD